MERLNQIKAEIHIPGQLLDTKNEIICSCGYKRDCGFMRTTADHLADVHSRKPGHDCVVVESPSKPPPRVETVKKIRTKHRRKWGNDGKLNID